MAEKKATKKAVEPVKLNLLAEQKEYVYTDKNGYEWKYLLQFPGMLKAQEILDDSQDENGKLLRAKMYQNYLKWVVVDPQGLTVDDFNERPGLLELMAACDSFLGELL